MTEPTLPRALRPWAEPLALLHPEVHEGVGHWLHPLRSLLGPLAVPSPVSAGEPDGYAGLASRGSYERLLTSEWVLAEELPDEFLRRAAAGEHVFLAPAYREPRTASTCVVLLDCGPLQLGTPRLAHLAALVVLRQRAHEGGALLRFGVLQDDAQRLYELTGPDLGAWLGGRTWRPPEPCVAAWGERLAALDEPDTWLVGGASLRAHADRLGAGLLEVEEATEGEAAVLRVRVHHRRQASRTIALPLPPPSTCVRILRSPLAPPPAVQRAAAASTGAAHDDLGQLSVDGSRWLLPREGAGIDALHVPPTTRQGPGRTKVILPRMRCALVAADMKGKRPVSLEIDEDGELVLGGSGLQRPGRGKARSLEDTMLTGLQAPPSFARGSTRLATMYVWLAQALSFRAWIIDAAQQLWALRIDLVPGTLEVRERVLELRDPLVHTAWRLDAQTLAWISEEHGLKTSRTLPGQETLLLDLHDAHVAVGPLRAGGHEALRVVVSRLSAHELVVAGGDGPVCTVPAPAGRVFGLGTPMRSSPARRLVVLYVRPDETTVWSRGLDGNDEPLFATAAPIAAIRHEPSCNRILWCTRRGERGVYDLGREAMVLRVLPSGRVEGGR